MKIGNKGFMLAEVVIVSSIIVTTLVVMYSSINKLYVKYDEQSRYYNIDAVYACKSTLDYLIDNYYLDDLITGSDYTDIHNDSYGKTIQDAYGVQKMYFIKGGELGDNINSLGSDDSYFKTYLNYLKKNNLVNGKNIIVTEIAQSERSYYGYVVIE